MKVSFIIVNYNVAQLLENCITSIHNYCQDIDYEVIVVDNNSSDRAWEKLISKFPDVHFIANKKNEGFAKANNKAVKNAAGEYLFFLNPDTELLGKYLGKILEFADSQENIGAIGLRMHDADGNFLPESKRCVPAWDTSFRKLFIGMKNSKKKSYYRNDIPETANAEVEVLTGANLLVKKQTYLEAGGFDEKYFMYGEDIDLCYSLLRAGFHNFYFGEYSILHLKGQSTEKNADYYERFYGAMQIFIDKYYKKDKPLQHRLLSAGLRLKRRMEAIKN